MRDRVWTFALLALSILSLALLRPGDVLVRALATFAVIFVLEAILPRNFRQRAPAFVAVGLALLWDLPLTYRLVLVVTSSLMGYARKGWARAALASMGLQTMAGFTRLTPTYLITSACYGLLVIGWLASRKRRALAAHGVVQPIGLLQVILSIIGLSLVVVAATGSIFGLPWLEGHFVEWSIGSGHLRRSGFSLITDLCSVSRLQQSRAIAIRLYAQQPRLLVGQLYSKYSNGRWAPTQIAPFTRVFPPDLHPVPPRDKWEWVENLHGGFRSLFIPLDARVMAAPGLRLERSSNGKIVSTSISAKSYAYVLAKRRQPLPLEHREAHLQLPDNLSSRVHIRARTWTRFAQTPLQRAQFIAKNLLSRYRYTLAPGRPRPGEEPIERFLFDTKAGHCEYFATTMVLLLRCVGIPSRYVAGYAPTAKNRFGGYYVARDCDAHAWVQAWFPETGWVSFDPTPPDWLAKDSWYANSFLEDALEYGWLHFARFRSTVRGKIEHAASQIPRWVVGLLLLILIPLQIFWGSQRARRYWRAMVEWLETWTIRAPRETNEAKLALAELERALRGVGLERSPSRTLREFLTSIEALASNDELGKLSKEIIEHISAHRYDRVAWDEQRIRRALASVQNELADRHE